MVNASGDEEKKRLKAESLLNGVSLVSRGAHHVEIWTRLDFSRATINIGGGGIPPVINYSKAGGGGFPPEIN